MLTIVILHAIITGTPFKPTLSQDWHWQAQKKNLTAFSTRVMCVIFNTTYINWRLGLQPASQNFKLNIFSVSNIVIRSKLYTLSCLSETWRKVSSIHIQLSNSLYKKYMTAESCPVTHCLQQTKSRLSYLTCIEFKTTKIDGLGVIFFRSLSYFCRNPFKQSTKTKTQDATAKFISLIQQWYSLIFLWLRYSFKSFHYLDHSFAFQKWTRAYFSQRNEKWGVLKHIARTPGYLLLFQL